MTELVQMDGSALAEVLAHSLEAAFISAAPAEPPFETPQDLALVRLAFKGPQSGALEMMAAGSLGAVLHANVTGEGADTPSAAAESQDALKELMNVTCGALLRGRPGAPQFEISLPTVITALDEGAWAAFAASDGAVVIDAESCLVAVRVVPCF